jgi:hypothetical protein
MAVNRRSYYCHRCDRVWPPVGMTIIDPCPECQGELQFPQETTSVKRKEPDSWLVSHQLNGRNVPGTP